MEEIFHLPMLHDMDADYSPEYVKLARLVRDKITAGEYEYGYPFPAAKLASVYNVSISVASQALVMLAANRYVNRPGHFACYTVTWKARA